MNVHKKYKILFTRQWVWFP